MGIINAIELNNRNNAKSICVLDICKIEPQTTRNTTVLEISTFGSQYEFLLKHLLQLQKYELVTECNYCKEKSTKSLKSLSFFQMDDAEIKLDIMKKENCTKCKNLMIKKYEFIKNPPWIIVDISIKSLIKIDMLPDILVINNLKYRFMCCTFYKSGHFKSIFKINNMNYLFDDLNPKMITENIPNHKITVCIYYLIEIEKSKIIAL